MVALVAGAGAALALRLVDWAPAPRAGTTFTVRHPAGWTLTLPRELEGREVVAERRAAGFSVDPDLGATVRYDREAFVVFHPRGEPPPTAWYDVRWVHGGWVHHAISRDENGNGDPIFTFTAWRRCGAGYFRFGETQASDLFTPAFQHAWAMIRGLSTQAACAQPPADVPRPAP